MERDLWLYEKKNTQRSGKLISTSRETTETSAVLTLRDESRDHSS